MKDWIKSIAVWFKLQFVTKYVPENKDIRSSNSDITSTNIENKLIQAPVQAEAKWFNRENDLVKEFAGTPPIVYEADMRTIVKQHQYGYIPKEEEVINKEPEVYFYDDIRLMDNIDKPRDISTTAEYNNQVDQFEDRWKQIKDEVIERNADRIIQDDVDLDKIEAIIES